MVRRQSRGKRLVLLQGGDGIHQDDHLRSRYNSYLLEVLESLSAKRRVVVQHIVSEMDTVAKVRLPKVMKPLRTGVGKETRRRGNWRVAGSGYSAVKAVVKALKAVTDSTEARRGGCTSGHGSDGYKHTAALHATLLVEAMMDVTDSMSSRRGVCRWWAGRWRAL